MTNACKWAGGFGLAAVALPIRRPDLYQASPANVKLLIIAATLLSHVARVQHVTMEPRYYAFGGWDCPSSD